MLPRAHAPGPSSLCPPQCLGLRAARSFPSTLQQFLPGPHPSPPAVPNSTPSCPEPRVLPSPGKPHLSLAAAPLPGCVGGGAEPREEASGRPVQAGGAARAGDDGGEHTAGGEHLRQQESLPAPAAWCRALSSGPPPSAVWGPTAVLLLVPQSPLRSDGGVDSLASLPAPHAVILPHLLPGDTPPDSPCYWPPASTR